MASSLAAENRSGILRRGRLSRWRRLGSAARFLLRSLRHRGWSFFLGWLAVAVGATVTATMLDIRADLSAKMSKELRTYGPNLLVTPRPAPSGVVAAPTMDQEWASRLPDAIATAGTPSSALIVSPFLIVAGTVEPAARADGRFAASPAAASLADEASSSQDGGKGAPVLSSATAPPRAPDAVAARGEGRESISPVARDARAAMAATIEGSDFESLRRIQPAWRVRGRWPGQGEASCLVGSALAARGGLEPGSRARLRMGPREATLAVAGVVSTGEAEDEAFFVPLSLVQEMTDLTGRISLAAVSVDGGEDAVAVVVQGIEAARPLLSARPLRQVAAAQGALLGKLQRMMVLLTLVILTLSGLCLVTTLMAIVVERESEIGVMRSIGAGDGEILLMFLGEVGLLGALGGLAGVVLGGLGARWIGSHLFGAAIAPRAVVVPLVFAVSLGLCLVSVLIPLRRALSVQPAVALRGD